MCASVYSAITLSTEDFLTVTITVRQIAKDIQIKSRTCFFSLLVLRHVDRLREAKIPAFIVQGRYGNQTHII